jgi:branched-chain amino acid transport system substrate-binding protein
MVETASRNNTSANLRAALKAGSWNGIFGPVKFASYGGFTNQNNHSMLVQQIQSGKYETVYPAQFSKKKLVYPFKR